MDNRETKVFTKEELSKYNGTNGMPSYVAYNGVVYDVSSIFVNGMHMGLMAGLDYTDTFNNCHSDKTVLNNLQRVGVISK